MAKGNLIRFDWAMKRLLRNKADYTVLEGFLSVLLDEDIKIINIKESESNQENADDKFNRVDIMVENSDGEICKVYHINIVYFRLGDGEDYVYRGIADFRGIHRNNVLKLTEEQKQFFVKEKVEDLFPEYYILCVRDFNDSAKDSLDEWIYYLKNTEIPDHFTARGLKEAREQLLYDNLSEAEKRAYDHHLNQTRFEQNVVEDAYSSGLFDGKVEGRAEGMETVAINCNRIGYSVEAISAITGLTPENIINILKREAK